MQSAVLKSFAKLNLRFKIIGKNAVDNHHYISSIFKIINLYDAITLTPILTDDLTNCDNITNIYADNILCNQENVANIDLKNNSILTALQVCRQILRSDFNFNLRYFDIKVKKSIPALSGLGGGSSNAACIINFAFNCYKNSPQYNRKDADKIANAAINIAKIIGMDTVFFVKSIYNLTFTDESRSKSAEANLNNLYFVSGYGENVVKISLKEAARVQPFDIFLFVDKKYSKRSTASMYKEQQCSEILQTDANSYDSTYLKHIQESQLHNLQDLARIIENDFLPSVKQQSFEIKSICDFFAHNKITHGLTGSGSCIFALTLNGKFVLEDFNELKTDFYYTLL